MELRKSKNRSKTLWENIDRLRKKERISGDDIHLFGEDGNQLNREQEKEELVRYWTKIYQQHDNDIDREWNPEAQKMYYEEIKEVSKQAFPKQLVEHIDMALHLDSNIVPMDKPEISDKQTALYIKGMKNHSASGPDELKNEMYKAIARTTDGMKVLTRCMMTELSTNSKPSSWMCSKTK